MEPGCEVHELAARGPVTIATAEAWRVSVPMLEPFRISSGEVAAKDAVVVRLSDGAHWGWGESSAMAGGFYSWETPEFCQQELVDKVLPGLLGKSWPTMLALEQQLASITSSRFVRVAIETAAWEMLARAAGVPLRTYLGLPDAAVRSGLAVGLYDNERELLAAIDRYGYRDYGRLKIKIKRGQDLSLVEAVRNHVGDFPLFVDANADYSLADIDIFRKLDGYGLMMFEQPLAREPLEDSAELQRQVRTPICMDESIESADDATRAATLGACRIVNIKLQRVGGYLEALRIAEVCQQHDIGLWMGTMPELGIGSAQALMFATHPGCRYPTDVEPSRRWYCDDIVSPALELREGEFVMPARAGLGFDVDMERWKPYLRGSWSFGR
jgi:o-succinylbenzoate synthase